jgi:hypothetical protein
MDKGALLRDEPWASPRKMKGCRFGLSSTGTSLRCDGLLALTGILNAQGYLGSGSSTKCSARARACLDHESACYRFGQAYCGWTEREFMWEQGRRHLFAEIGARE